jgi:hypothetical protein
MKHVYAALLGAAVLAGSLFAASTPADAKWCFTFCERYVYTHTCRWVTFPPPGHLVCTWNKVCVKWRTICLPLKLEVEKLPHVFPPPPPPPDPLKELFRLPKEAPIKR